MKSNIASTKEALIPEENKTKKNKKDVESLKKAYRQGFEYVSKEVVSITMDTRIIRIFKDMANKEERNLSWVLRDVINDWLIDHNKLPKPGTPRLMRIQDN